MRNWRHTSLYTSVQPDIYIYIVSIIFRLIYFWQRRCLNSVSCTDMTRLHRCATELRSTCMLDEISALLILSCTVSEILAGCCKKTCLVISFTSLPDGRVKTVTVALLGAINAHYLLPNSLLLKVPNNNLDIAESFWINGFTSVVPLLNNDGS